MIELWYMDIEQMTSVQFDQSLTLLPVEIQQDILRYRFQNDQQRKLLGRIMVSAYFQNQSTFDWANFYIQPSGKPAITGSTNFSISHSGAYVFVGFATDPIGVDVEEQRPVAVEELLHYFHPNEIRYVEEQQDKLQAFHTIWTRKEAFLKAKGIGLLEGTSHVNCEPNQLIEESVWIIKTLDFQPGYTLSVCHPEPMKAITIKQQSIDELISLLKTNQ